MKELGLLVLVCLALRLHDTEAAAPEVSLSHGGVLIGKAISFQDIPVDLFLGKSNWLLFCSVLTVRPCSCCFVLVFVC